MWGWMVVLFKPFCPALRSIAWQVSCCRSQFSDRNHLPARQLVNIPRIDLEHQGCHRAAGVMSHHGHVGIDKTMTVSQLFLIDSYMYKLF